MQAHRFMLAWLGLMAVVPAQNFYPKKDGAFGQVVMGDGFETVINLTNRGTSEYTGTMILFRLENAAWNPVVNGRAVRDGEYGIRIGPGATVTLRLTGSQLESGAAILLSDDLLLDNLIEANLTCLVLEDGQVSDSVGISPSQEPAPQKLIYCESGESVHISSISRRIERLCTSKSRKSGLDSPLSRYDHFYGADS